jgi:hypothetical protein
VRLTLLGGRSTVGHRALDAVIGVRIPASQPIFLIPFVGLRGHDFRLRVALLVRDRRRQGLLLPRALLRLAD